MFKKFGLSLILFLAMFSTIAEAHTGLEASTPANGEIVTTELKEVTLTFESKIEETSSLQLVDSSGNQIELSQVKVEENLLKGNVATIPPNGNYQILWKIVGEDGHVIDGEISFTLNVPEKKEAVEPVVKKESEEKKQVTKKEEKVEQSSNSLLPMIILPLGLLGGGTLWWLMRRKK